MGITPSPEELSENSRSITEHSALDLDTLSFDSADSLQAQLRSINRHLDEVQMKFHKSKEELDEVPLRGSPFIQEVQDKPIPQSFRLPRSNPMMATPTQWNKLLHFEPRWPCMALQIA